MDGPEGAAVSVTVTVGAGDGSAVTVTVSVGVGVGSVDGDGEGVTVKGIETVEGHNKEVPAAHIIHHPHDRARSSPEGEERPAPRQAAHHR